MFFKYFLLYVRCYEALKAKAAKFDAVEEAGKTDLKRRRAAGISERLCAFFIFRKIAPRAEGWVTAGRLTDLQLNYIKL